ncbi:PEP-CTERM sorting domain-containing protein [Janthinobacterium sp. DSP2-3-3]|uniref:PEP-CTERM sorting domain-containing protein n=1 Tax=unclassified Janthinobacterium TaxID=2610881 RepID=UPI003CF0657D
MKTPATLFKIAALAALATAGAANAATELVVNGSFENNVIASAWAPLSSVTGWTSSASGNSAFEIQKGATQGGQGGFNPVAANGTQYLELNTDQLTSVSQAIGTTAGGTYALSFAYSGRPNTAGGANSLMNVYWGSTLLTPTALVGNTGGVWQSYNQNLTALGSSTVLRFESIGPVSAPTYGSYLDNVSVMAAVPEPESYAMMLLGLGLLGFMARRKTAA